MLQLNVHATQNHTAAAPLPQLCPAAPVTTLPLLQGQRLLPPPTAAAPAAAVLLFSRPACRSSVIHNSHDTALAARKAPAATAICCHHPLPLLLCCCLVDLHAVLLPHILDKLVHEVGPRTSIIIVAEVRLDLLHNATHHQQSRHRVKKSATHCR